MQAGSVGVPPRLRTDIRGFPEETGVMFCTLGSEDVQHPQTDRRTHRPHPCGQDAHPPPLPQFMSVQMGPAPQVHVCAGIRVESMH